MKKKIFFVLLLGFYSGMAFSQTVHYVKVGGTGDGSTWNKAAADLQVMINTAVAGDEIWVAAGTYIPRYVVNNVTGPATPSNRDNAFLLKTDVKLYGGFAGTETALIQRDLSLTANKTILSGDFNSDDIVTGSGATLSFAGNTENAYHVVLGYGNLGTALLDGFTVQGGNANTATSLAFMEVNFARSSGGGMSIGYSSLSISNCNFMWNNSSGYGGGIDAIDSDLFATNCNFINNKSFNGGGISTFGNHSSVGLIFINCNFNGNSARLGGGVSLESTTGVISTSLFRENFADRDGGGICNTYNANTSLTNCLITKNSAGDDGGGIYNSATSNITLTNSTVSTNEAQETTGKEISHQDGEITLNNSIVYPNRSTFSGAIIRKNSLVNGFSAANTNLNDDTNINNIDGATNPLFVDAATGDFTLQSSSLVLNKGDNSLFTALGAQTLDLAGKARLFGPVIDLGPYENQDLMRQIIKAGEFTKNYGDAPFDPGATASSGLPVSYVSEDNTIAQAFQDTADDNKWKLRILKAGAVTITASQTGNDLYGVAENVTFQLTINPKEVVVTADTKTKIYGDTDPILTYTVTPALLGTDKFSGSLSREAGENAGTYTINQGTLDNSNYAITYVNMDLIITPKAVTVTADTKNKVYGDKDPLLTYTVAPALVGTDKFSGALSREAGENAGTYTINQGTLALGSNYALAYAGVAGNFTITPKAVTVTADTKNKVYGDTDPLLTYTVAPALLGTDKLSGGLSRETGENAGIYAINQGTLVLGNNYSIIYAGSNFTITPKAVTVTADTKTKIYGDTDPLLTYTVTPALLGTDTFSGALTRNLGENAGAYAINRGTFDNSNYAITYVNTDLTITPKAVTVTADAKSKVYGDTDPLLTYTVTPALLGTDTFNGTLTRNLGENAGAYAINQGTLDNSNYAITYVNTDLTITPKAVTVTADAKSKTYGDADPVLTYMVMPALLGADKFNGTLSRDTGENAGIYAIKQGTLANNNYSISVYWGANLTINKAGQNINWNQTLVNGCGDSTQILLTATASSGLPITYVSSNTDIATINGSELSVIKNGMTVITASQEGNSNYLAAATVENRLISSLSSSMIVKRWNDVLVFDNSSNEYVSWKWYKNGALILGATDQYYNENGGLEGDYYVEVKTKSNLTMRTCPLTVVPKDAFIPLMVYPNPVGQGQAIKVKTGYTAQVLKDASITVTNLLGQQLHIQHDISPETMVTMPSATGIFILQLNLSNGAHHSINVLVK